MRSIYKPLTPKGRIIVNGAKDIVYVRVPRGANTSIRLAIPDAQEEKVSPSRLYKNYPNAFIFSFARNPWARLVSGYRSKLCQRNSANKAAFKKLVRLDSRFRQHMPFEEFAELICGLPDRKVEKHFRSQSYFLKHKGQLIPDFVGRLENIQADWEKVQAITNANLPLQHTNRSGATHYQEYYATPRLRELVADRYAEDISSFGYHFDE